MEITPNPIETFPPYLNPNYTEGQKVKANHTFDIDGDIVYLDFKSRGLNLTFTINFNDRKGAETIATFIFYQKWHIELSATEDDETALKNELSTSCVSVQTLLLEKLPPETVEILPPLVMHYYIEEQAANFYNRLIYSNGS